MHSTTFIVDSSPFWLSLSQKTKPATGPIGPLCSRLHHWLRLPHRCPSLRNRVLSLYHAFKFSRPMVPKRSKNHKLLTNLVEQARYTVSSGIRHCPVLGTSRVMRLASKHPPH